MSAALVAAAAPATEEALAAAVEVARPEEMAERGIEENVPTIGVPDAAAAAEVLLAAVLSVEDAAADETAAALVDVAAVVSVLLAAAAEDDTAVVAAAEEAAAALVDVAAAAVDDEAAATDVESRGVVTHEVTSCISTVPSAPVTGVSVIVQVSSIFPLAVSIVCCDSTVTGFCLRPIAAGAAETFEPKRARARRKQ